MLCKIMTDQFPCPQCASLVPATKEERPSSFPFCSQRCRNIDLGAWADGAYSVPGRSVAVDMSELDDDPLEALRSQAQQLRGDRS